jgi:3-mercaptopyruvate sulfurtransferase SseA
MKKVLLAISILLLATLACNASIPQTEPTAPATPTLDQSPLTVIAPTQPQRNDSLPLTETDVPRVPVEEAKAALDSGTAVIVDVRSADAYAAGHVVGSINIPLTEFENNIANVSLAKDQWIITYCT